MSYCEARARTVGLCENHYARKRRGRPDWDQPSQSEKTPEARFWEKVNKFGGMPDFSDPLVLISESSGECWMWTAGRRKAYGCFVLDGKNRPAHVASLIFAGIEVDPALTVDHLCRRTLCVNPSHLEQIESSVNIRRSGNITAQNSRKTHCPRGHKLSGGNVYSNRRDRTCVPCNREGNRRRSAARSYCKNGHEFTEQNTVIGSDGRRICIPCKATFIDRYGKRGKAAA